MKHSILRAAFVAAIAAGFCAIGDAAAQQAAPPAPYAGVYTLAQVDKADLPMLVSEKDGCKHEITAAKLTLTAESKYRLEATVRETCGEKTQEKTKTEQGSFSGDASKLTFTSAEQPTKAAEKAAAAPVDVGLARIASATFAENTLTVALDKEARVLIFRK
jgi:hypothetical protein